MADQTASGTYRDFADFAERNGIRLQDTGTLTGNSDDVLIAAMASNAAAAAEGDPNTKIGYATALNQTLASATVVLGEQTAADQGVIKLFNFNNGKTEVTSYDGTVTIGADGKASIDLDGGTQHGFETDEEYGAYDNLTAAFKSRADIGGLEQGEFAAYAQREQMPIGGISSPEGRYRIEDMPGDGPRSLTSCAPLSPNFAVCASNVYAMPANGDPAFTAKMQVIAVKDGDAATAEAGVSRPMKDELGEFDRFRSYQGQGGIHTYKPS